MGRGVPQSDIHFATSKAGIGKEAVQLAGYPHATLSGRGIQRSFKPEAVLQQFRSIGEADLGSCPSFQVAAPGAAQRGSVLRRLCVGFGWRGCSLAAHTGW